MTPENKPIPPTFPNAHALVIGIAAYTHARPLPPTRDAADIAALLVDPAFCGYAPENVALLEEERATGAAIRAALADLAARTDAGSTVFLFFSGHGGRIADGPGRGEYLIPVDGEVETEAALAATCIADSEFSAALAAITARKMVVVLDCCHAAGMDQAKDVKPRAGGEAGPGGRLTAGLSEGYIDALAAGRGRVVYASSRDDQVSYVLPGDTYGLFTKHLLGGLRGGVSSDDGFVRVWDLFEFARNGVIGERPGQNPVFKAVIEENFAVARFRGGEKGVVARDEQGFRYDAYINFADAAPDGDWVRGTLVPRLQQAGVRLALSEDIEELGVPRLMTMSEAVAQCKRIVVILSDRYLADRWADFEGKLAYTIGIEEGRYRVLPVVPHAMEQALPPIFLMLVTLDLTEQARVEAGLGRLVKALLGPLPEH
jgi:hypothetical protein